MNIALVAKMGIQGTFNCTDKNPFFVGGNYILAWHWPKIICFGFGRKLPGMNAWKISDPVYLLFNLLLVLWSHAESYSKCPNIFGTYLSTSSPGLILSFIFTLDFYKKRDLKPWRRGCTIIGVSHYIPLQAILNINYR